MMGGAAVCETCKALLRAALELREWAGREGRDYRERGERGEHRRDERSEEPRKVRPKWRSRRPERRVAAPPRSKVMRFSTKGVASGSSARTARHTSPCEPPCAM